MPILVSTSLEKYSQLITTAGTDCDAIIFKPIRTDVLVGKISDLLMDFEFTAPVVHHLKQLHNTLIPQE